MRMNKIVKFKLPHQKPRRHDNYELDNEDTAKMQLHLRRLKSVDEKEFTDFGKSDLVGNKKSGKDKINLKGDRIKLAAIYDDEKEIMKILHSEVPNSVQELLSMQDERGQPCIFYALESRSQKALVYLLGRAEKESCVIAGNGESVLHVAAKIGDVHILRSLLNYDRVAQFVDHVERGNGRAPLHFAAIFNHVEIAQELLVHGASLDREDITGKTPIFMAASKGHAGMLEIFLQHGRNNIERLMLDSRLYGNMYDNLLQVAVESGDESTVHVCLDQDAQIVRRCLKEEIRHGEGGLIHSACQNGMEKCLLKIVESMDNLETLHLNRKDKLGFTPIHKATINNHYNLVRYIGSISRSFINQTTVYSQTPLILATQHGHIKVVEELLKLKAEFRTTDDSDRTVLHFAINFPDILKLLLKRKDVAQLLINAKEKDGYTPIHNAALKGLCESVRILLEYGADINVFTNTSRSPLHCAVSSQSVDVVQLVLSNEPALINKPDATGKTPLHTAASYGSAEVVRQLLEHGALIVRDGNMYSPLHNAAHKGHLEIVEILMETNKKIVDWKNKYGRTALIAAASTGKSDVVKFLLDHEASITEDHEFFNCLDWCLIRNDKETAMKMMSHSRWSEILITAKHSSEGTMAKLVYKMPEVAYRVLSNSVTSRGHPDSKEHVKQYYFLCLQTPSPEKKNADKVKPLTAIKTMVRTQCYSCLCHPLCCKFLKAKWMEFGWKVHSLSLLMYLVFLITLNVYAFRIPSFKEAQKNSGNVKDASIKVKIAMVFCLFFASFNALKEIIQMIFYHHEYFMDKVNYLECILYACTFIFSVPVDGKVAVKTSVQWQACAVALLLSWINLVLYLRRFASYGIIVLMMKKISATLMKVLSLLIFFFVAFAAAFTVLMNDEKEFKNLGLSMITSAVMTLGEFDFKDTFLGEGNNDFHWLRLAILVAFLVLMPIILMNLLLALAIDDTSSIMQQAKLKKHIQTANMIIDLERKRKILPWFGKPKPVPTLTERPNKRVSFLRAVMVYLLYGPDYTSDEGTTKTYDKRTRESAEEKFDAMVNIMKNVQVQMTELRQEMFRLQNGGAALESHSRKESGRPVRMRRDASTQFRGHSDSLDDGISDDDLDVVQKKRKVWTTTNTSFNKAFSLASDHQGVDPNDVVFREEQDVEDERNREMKEHDPELQELKELHSKTAMEEYESVDSLNEDSEDEGLTPRLAKLFQRSEEMPDEKYNNVV